MPPNDTGDTTAPNAPGVERIDVEAVNASANRPLYEKRKKIFPRKASGPFRKLKWGILAVTLGIYYLLPWVRWDRGPNSPDQAVLVDFPTQRFYFFFIEIWPQEIYFVTGLLILAALSLFLITSIAGRVWCGYTCPQTVWTDLFILVERLIEGDRNARMRLNDAPWSAAKIRKRALKHAAWLIIAVCTGGAWVFYFADAPTLAAQLVRFDAPLVSYIFIGVLTFTTYMLAGHAREQVCTYMCPWPRIQGAAGNLSQMAGRAARIAQEKRALGRPRRLRGLQFLRCRLPDGDRHPRRRTARMHQLRAVHRRLRRHHGKSRPAARADRL